MDTLLASFGIYSILSINYTLLYCTKAQYLIVVFCNRLGSIPLINMTKKGNMRNPGILLLLFLFCLNANAECVIYYKESPLEKKQDAVGILLANENICPDSIQDFKKITEKNNLQYKTGMVANRGKNNPQAGSFSFFESVTGVLPNGTSIRPGEFYLGYFTDLDHNSIKLDQQPAKNKLLIELIAWDYQHQLFNFYELRGLDDTKTRWYYRGNSQDALLDNRYLYRQPPSDSKKFGARMRCSACHNSGGPILKEIKKPHNDWWSDSNPLVFLPNYPDDEVNIRIHALVDAKDFSHEVLAGIKKLQQSTSFKSSQKALSLQEKLRPLFCTSEINIESSPYPGPDATVIKLREPTSRGLSAGSMNLSTSLDPADKPRDVGEENGLNLMAAGPDAPVTIPSAFFLNPLLDQIKITVSAQAYQQLLIENHMQFPETRLKDADHAWLTPVKGINDILAIRQLIKDNLVSQHFVQSVLIIDYAHPVFSKQRCELLKWIPEHDEDWETHFIHRLRQENTTEASLLAAYLTNPNKYSHAYFQHILSEYKSLLKTKANSINGLQELFNQLLKTRQDVFENELSKNPLGQILEPGFRVIFPVPLMS